MKSRLKAKIPVYFLLFAGLFFSCVSTNNKTLPFPLDDSSLIPKDFSWQPVSPGIDYFDFENPELPLLYHAVRIDLSRQDLELLYYPDSNTKKDKGGRFKGMKTSLFAQKEACDIAINTTPFQGRFSKKKNVGMHCFDKNVFSPAISRYAAITFSKQSDEVTGASLGYTCEIIKNQNPSLAQNYDFIFGGFFLILQNNEVQPFAVESYHARCGAGISQDGKTLYLLVVEGDNKKSAGLSYPQCGKIFKAMGCSQALEFDGGSSTELCINGKSLIEAGIKPLQASSLGFRIRK